MAHVTIDSGPVDATYPLRDVPQGKWFELMQVRRDFLGIHLPYDCRRLLEFVEDAEQMFEPLGFASVEDFIKRGLQLDAQQVAWAVAGLRQMRPDEPIPYAKAVALGQHGGARAKGQASDRSLRVKAGENRDYILARLERDGHTELAAQVRAETMSAKAAADAVEMFKRPTPLDRLRKAWAKATPEDREIFRAEIDAENPN